MDGGDGVWGATAASSVRRRGCRRQSDARPCRERYECDYVTVTRGTFCVEA